MSEPGDNFRSNSNYIGPTAYAGPNRFLAALNNPLFLYSAITAGTDLTTPEVYASGIDGEGVPWNLYDDFAWLKETQSAQSNAERIDQAPAQPKGASNVFSAGKASAPAVPLAFVHDLGGGGSPESAVLQHAAETDLARASAQSRSLQLARNPREDLARKKSPTIWRFL